MTMDIKVRSFGGAMTLADNRQVRCIVSSETVDSYGDIVVQAGIDLSAYRKNPVILWGHSPDEPIARAVDIGLVNGKLQATAQFPPAGEDPESDRVYGKIRSGLVNACSIGFSPIKGEPLKTGGVRWTACRMHEFSFVAIGANGDALITQRDARGQSRDAEMAALRKEIALHRKADALRFQLELEAMGKKLRAELIGRR